MKSLGLEVSISTLQVLQAGPQSDCFLGFKVHVSEFTMWEEFALCVCAVCAVCVWCVCGACGCTHTSGG